MAKTAKETPMMQQYNAIKAQYPDAFLFYRLGDFYELFNDDAIKGAQILELTLTTRNKNADNPIPMCGVPHHAAQNYIDILVDKGYKVAIVEQMEDPKQAEGMVKRDVVQLVTPGTKFGTQADAKENNYITALTHTQTHYGLAYADLSTGEEKVTILMESEEVFNEILNLQTKEVVVDTSVEAAITEKLTKLGILVSQQPNTPTQAEVSFLTQTLTDATQQLVASNLVGYLTLTQKRSLAHLQEFVAYEPMRFLKMDHNSRYNLELTQNIRTGKKQGTLLWLLDETKTAMGGRMLKQWLDRPLLTQSTIINRQTIVAGLLENYFERTAIQDDLVKVYDLERLVGRVAFGSVNGRDLIQLKTSLEQVPKLRATLKTLPGDVFGPLVELLDPVREVTELITVAINDEAPLSITEGGVIADGYSNQLDQYRDVMKNGKQWLAQLEAREREVTGINGLKIGYNRVFGYFIEVTKANIAKLDPERYERKQTLTNAERFSTPELKEREALILEAQDKSTELEYQLFVEIREVIKTMIGRLQALAQAIAELDVLQSFAVVAETYHFVQPTFTNDANLAIVDGRHPVVEKVLGRQAYVPNDIKMNPDNSIMLITGPNMSGKSTYMRQLALIVILAQVGSFVPATSAALPIFDQIFTRIGAADDLISGDSTFMVEMGEANNALKHATPASLILFDELGRGTATYDGMALAQAIIEYVHQNVHAKTLFSTHYHELTALADELPGLKNMHVGAIEQDGDLVFVHKMEEGPADQSYGINVAKLAGMPAPLLARAEVILNHLEQQGSATTLMKVVADEPSVPVVPPVAEVVAVPQPEANVDDEQLDLFAQPALDPQQQAILDELKGLNLAMMTPLDALNKLFALQQKL